jgi:hypothetical protein
VGFHALFIDVVAPGRLRDLAATAQFPATFLGVATERSCTPALEAEDQTQHAVCCGQYVGHIRARSGVNPVVHFDQTASGHDRSLMLSFQLAQK